MPRDILHCDMNNFYASVECMLDPALKKYPVAVCGSVEDRNCTGEELQGESLSGANRRCRMAGTAEVSGISCCPTAL